MNAVALDTSVAAAWVLDDEDEPYANAVFSLTAVDRVLVPQFWHIEMRNVLLSAERQNRLSPARARQHLQTLAALPIDTDGDTDLDGAYELAKAHRLTIYDALYLELAQRRSTTLATLDRALRRAAKAEGLL
jgi:predicted nucleic acid-binding protein